MISMAKKAKLLRQLVILMTLFYASVKTTLYSITTIWECDNITITKSDGTRNTRPTFYPNDLKPLHFKVKLKISTCCNNNF